MVGQDLDRLREIIREVPPDVASLRAADRSSDPVAPVVASTPGTAEEAGTADAPPRLELRNGNVLRGAVGPSPIRVETPYGKLDIPTEDLVRIHFRVRTPPAVQEAIDAAIAGLGDDRYEVREAASSALRELFPDSIPRLRRIVDAGVADAEVRLRAGEILREAESMASGGDTAAPLPRLEGMDRIVTRDFELEGRVAVGAFRVDTHYGVLSVAPTDVVRVVFRDIGPEEATVEIPATSLVPASWTSTGIRIEKGKRIGIQATGQMSVPSHGETCGPEGSRRTSRTLPGFRELSLVAKVGERGAIFAVGRTYSGAAPAPGVLYLGVVPFRYGAPTGSFRAEIVVK